MYIVSQAELVVVVAVVVELLVVAAVGAVAVLVDAVELLLVAVVVVEKPDVLVVVELEDVELVVVVPVVEETRFTVSVPLQVASGGTSVQFEFVPPFSGNWEHGPPSLKQSPRKFSIVFWVYVSGMPPTDTPGQQSGPGWGLSFSTQLLGP
jgi:hypothetical protein